MSNLVHWRLEFDRDAQRALRKLDPQITRRIVKALDELARLDDPTSRCKALSGPLVGLWRLRVGDYRILLNIQQGALVIIILDLGHRSSIYD